MEIIPLNIVGDSAGGIYETINPSNTVNMIEVDGALVNFMGYKLASSNYTGNARGAYGSQRLDRLLLGFGNKIYSTLFPISDEVGTLGTTNTPITFGENFNKQIAIEDETAYYVYDYGADTFTKENVGFIPNCLTYDGKSGRIFASKKGTNEFGYTAPNDATLFEPDNVGNIGNDILVAVKALGPTLFVTGTIRTQIWRDSGANSSPYRLDGSIIIEFGVASKTAIASGFGYVVWVATSPAGNITVVASKGGGAERILPPNIQFKLSNLSNPQTCYSAIFQEYGSIFYIASFIEDEVTLLINLTFNKFYYLTNEENKAHILKYLTFFQDRYLFLSRQDSNVYHLSSEFQSYDGMNITKWRTTDNIRFPGNQPRRIIRLELVIEQGLGVDGTVCDLSISKNGGITFGNAVRKSFAPIGKTRALFRYNNLGFGRTFCFRFSLIGKSRVVILSAFMEVE